MLNDNYPALINVKVSLSGNVIYHENLPFRTDPVDEDIISFLKLIRSSMRNARHDRVICDYIVYTYVRLLKPSEL